MKKFVRKYLSIVGLFAAFVALSLARAANDKELKIDIELMPSKFPLSPQSLDAALGEEGDQFLCVVRFQNVGPAAIRVPKGVPKDVILNSEIIANGKLANRLIIGWELKKQNGRYVDIPSSVDLKIVELMPGESSEIRFGLRMGRREEIASFNVFYHVESALASRFNVWCGECESEFYKPTKAP